MTPFARDGGTVTARFTPHERVLLSGLAHQLVQLLDERVTQSPADLLYVQLGIGGSSAPPLDPAVARLLPDAYRDDSEAASEHRRLTELGLVDRKVANAMTVIRVLGDKVVVLDEADVQSWLRHFTDLRLVLAVRLQIEVDGDEVNGDEPMLDLYDWLGYLQGTLVECLE